MNSFDIENRIVGKLIDDALTAGYELSVWDGEDWGIHRSTDRDAIIKAMRATDFEHLYYFQKGAKCSSGGVFLVYGNGVDVICDCTVSIEHMTKGASKLAETLS